MQKWVGDSVTRILKFSVTNFLAKVAQLFGDFLGYFEKYHFLSKNCRGYFGSTFEKFGLLFYSIIIIWSHWLTFGSILFFVNEEVSVERLII